MLMVKEWIKEEMLELDKDETLQVFAVIENPQKKRFPQLKGNYITEKVYIAFTGNEFRIKGNVTGQMTLQNFKEFCEVNQIYSTETEAIDEAKRLTEQIKKEVKATLLADF